MTTSTDFGPCRRCQGTGLVHKAYADEPTSLAPCPVCTPADQDPIDWITGHPYRLAWWAEDKIDLTPHEDPTYVDPQRDQRALTAAFAGSVAVCALLVGIFYLGRLGGLW